jgi:hypothetical protein
MLHSSAEFIDLQKRNLAQRANGSGRATIKRNLRCMARFGKKPQNFSGEVVQPLTRGGYYYRL